jgi:aminopeptidase N
MAESAVPLTVLKRADYRPVPYSISLVSLVFKIIPNATIVESSLTFKRCVVDGAPPLFLHKGEGVTVQSVALDGAALPEASYTLSGKGMTIAGSALPPAASFVLTIKTCIVPETNTSLEGLYRSGDAYSTQCEAEGFRHITPYLDRPDVMAVWTVRMEADRAECPVLLSNGNCVEAGALEGGRHFAVYHDPWPKPCYLFAVVAGRLTATKDVFVTSSGKKVDLAIWTAARDADKTAWAMNSLKNALRWEETRWGLEYDLDIFNIVAVSDFSMGAMENKSLNIFNSRLVLSSPRTATDVDFNRIEGVVGHEAFHNWTGNRVTCRDWFQLTLKEGLTVYRDQEFTSDLNSRPVKRIEDVSRLRMSQFSEDAGPTAHPVRPQEVGKMDNFYTATVYEKGAEVVRMYATMLGRDGFRAGMDLYFLRHDGQAVTCEEFFHAMVDANAGKAGVEAMPSLLEWYAQAGTPELTVQPSYDAEARTLTLTCTQRTPAPDGKTTVPVLIPIAVGLLGPTGADLPLTLAAGTSAAVAPGSTTAILPLAQASQTFTFADVPAGVVPSILRDFSAPVRLTVLSQSDDNLAFMLAHDSDAFNRWEAGQRLGRKALEGLYVAALAAGAVDSAADVKTVLDAAGGLPSMIVKAFTSVLADASLDGSFLARAITLPAESELVDGLAAAGTGANPVLVHFVRAYAVRELAVALRLPLEAAVAAADKAIASSEAAGGFSSSFEAVARRAQRNKALGYLSTLQDGGVTADLSRRFTAASNMTDEFAMLACLAEQPSACPERALALESFQERYKDEPLVLLKWLGLMGGCADPGNTPAVAQLMTHSAFSVSNPNSVYALLGGYAAGSVPAFHAADGSGYVFLADVVRRLDVVNPQVASRIVSSFTRFKQFDALHAGLMRSQLEALAAGKLSENVGEIVARSLA